MTVDIYLGEISTLQQALPLTAALNYLDETEMAAVARIKAERRLNEFVYARYFAKHYIAQKLNKPSPKSITFKKHDNGKLYLDNNPLYFNITHSGDYIAFAISTATDIGLDIEHPERRSNNLLDIAERYFTTEEFTALKNANNESQTQLFFKIWTLKEAVLKATGLGIAAGLDSIDVLHKPTPCVQYCEINQRSYPLAIDYWHEPLGSENTFLSIAAISDTLPIVRLHSLHEPHNL